MLGFILDKLRFDRQYILADFVDRRISYAKTWGVDCKTSHALACGNVSTHMPTVKLENLTKRFDDIVALDGVNLDIHDQEFFVLLGQTGAGKTTTLRCIAGLDLPENGAIYLDNQQINHLTPAERDVAFVFQAHILYPPPHRLRKYGVSAAFAWLIGGRDP